MSQKETVEEFLERGGTIKKLKVPKTHHQERSNYTRYKMSDFDEKRYIPKHGRRWKKKREQGE